MAREPNVVRKPQLGNYGCGKLNGDDISICLPGREVLCGRSKKRGLGTPC